MCSMTIYFQFHKSQQQHMQKCNCCIKSYIYTVSHRMFYVCCCVVVYPHIPALWGGGGCLSIPWKGQASQAQRSTSGVEVPDGGKVWKAFVETQISRNRRVQAPSIGSPCPSYLQPSQLLSSFVPCWTAP